MFPFRRRRSDADLEEELRLHLEFTAEAEGASGREPDDARRRARLRAGGLSQALDAMRDQRGWPRLESVAADVVFAWRQLKKHRGASLAAVLSLGVALGGVIAAFRLVDAVLLRPLPIAQPERVFAVATTFVGSDGQADDQDEFDDPSFRRYASAIGDQADLLVVGTTAPMELSVDGGDVDRVSGQFVSGNLFGVFGLRPALGRLIDSADDVEGHTHDVAVLSHDFWVRRFGGDPGILHRVLNLGARRYEVIGVAPKGFTGTEPGRITDLFVPAMTNTDALNSPGWSWFRIWIRPKAGVKIEAIRLRLQSAFSEQQRVELMNLPPEMPRARIEAFLNEQVRLVPAASGISGAQKALRAPMLILGSLVMLVLFIACANVANLQAAQALGRAREMALRIAIGAGRGRLVQLVLVESALLAVGAAVIGSVFAAWSAPLVVSMLSAPEQPIRLVLDADWRAVSFGVAATMAVAFLAGLAPALRASAVDPIAALKETGPASPRRRLAFVLVAAQTAFCIFVLCAAALFVTSLGRLSNHDLGFAPDGVLVVDTNGRGPAEPEGTWDAVSAQLRAMPGVQSVAVAGWAPLSDKRMSAMVGLPGQPMDPISPYFVNVSSGYFDTLRIGMIDGRDFKGADVPPMFMAPQAAANPVAIVNEAFARQYFEGHSPVGRTVNIRGKGKVTVDVPVTIVGLVADTAYSSVREAMHSIVYLPIGRRGQTAIIVRTASGDPMALAPTIRRPLAVEHPELQLAVTTQSALVRRQMVRERLLAALSVFFALVGLLLAGLGLYGVLNQSVAQRRREIGVRMALGARAGQVVGGIVAGVAGMVAAGALAGLAGGVLLGRAARTLLFELTPTDPIVLVAPLLLLGLTAAVSALPPAWRAVRIDPMLTIRNE